MRNLHFFLLLSLLYSCQIKEYRFASPNGDLEMRLAVGGSAEDALTYELQYKGQTVLAPSSLGLTTVDGLDLASGVRVEVSESDAVNHEWKPVYGERNAIPDRYREWTVRLTGREDTSRRVEIVFRLYDEGLAYRYRLLGSGKAEHLTVEQENSGFAFAADAAAWVSSRAQSEISRQRLSEVRDVVERPLVVELSDRLFAAVGEAGLVDFPRMKLSADTTRAFTLRAELAGQAVVNLPYETPWRYVMAGESPGQLLENNYLLLNLNEPCQIDDTSWIRPGKVIREVTLTTQGGLACVDFAAEHGLQYVEFDAGWYGPENDETSDARTVTVDPKRSPGPLDLPRVIEYATAKNIGVLLYVNRRALERQLDDILPLYRSWGVKGVKYGFVQVGSQEWTDWLHRAVRQAAENRLMVDIHDEYRPTGYSRTYPNLMTQEGIRGDEESPSTAHTLTTLFTRMIAGAGDNTICYYAPRVTEKMGGHAAQLAKAVLLYSPWQFLYWYDRPEGSPRQKGGAGASTGVIGTDPELSFFRELPTVWDETKVIEGAIGRFATIARRSGDRWFVGSLTAEGRTVALNLHFLDAGRDYEATIYTHDPASPSTTQVGISRRIVRQGEVLSFPLETNRGLAAVLRPVE